MSAKGRAAAFAACLFFFAAGQAFIPRLGIENDEAVFANSLFRARDAWYQIGGIPLMVTSYAGALKTLLFAPLFRLFGTGVWALREPMLLAAALSVWLFFLLLRRVAGTRAAVIGTCLLAADSEYLLTSVYDWGPVALQHLLLAGGVLLAVRFTQTRGLGALAGAAFLMGLAMWEKALAVWMLSGLGIAAALIYGRSLWRLFTLRRAAIATGAFCLGALPLILYNAHSGFDTFRKNAARDTIPLSAKAKFLLAASDGGGLFGFFTPEDWQTPAPHEARTAAERLSSFLSAAARHPRHNGTPVLLLAALIAAPFAGRAAMRAALFCLIAMAIAWFEMAINANTGASVHHTILLWPLPQAIIALSLAGVSRRLGRTGAAAIAAVLALAVFAGALVTNEYRAQMVRNGGTAGWTPALFPLLATLESNAQSAGSEPGVIFCMDWGMLNSLLLLSDGKLDLLMGSDPVYNKRP